MIDGVTAFKSLRMGLPNIALYIEGPSTTRKSVMIIEVRGSSPIVYASIIFPYGIRESLVKP